MTMVRPVLSSVRLLVVVAVVKVVMAAAPAQADTQYQLTVGVTGGATDNAQATASGTPGAAADGFAMTRAGGVLLLITPRANHALGYNFAATSYLRASQGTSISNGVSWLGAVTPTAATTLSLGLNLTHSRTTTVDAFNRGAVGPPMMGARPAGALYYLSAGGQEALSWAPTSNWHVTQALTAYALRPLDDATTQPRTMGYDNTVGIGRVWARDEIGWSLRLGQTFSSEVKVNDVVASPSHKSNLGELLATWRHDYTDAWQSELGVGALAVEIPETDVQTIEPAGRGVVSYNRPGYNASLSVAHTVTPNIFLGDAVVRDQVELGGYTFVDRWEQARLRVAVGYEHERAQLAAGDAVGTAHVVHALASLSYTTNGPITYSLDYRFIRQDGGAMVDGVLGPFQTYQRNIIMASVEVRYPYVTVQAAAPAARVAPPR